MGGARNDADHRLVKLSGHRLITRIARVIFLPDNTGQLRSVVVSQNIREYNDKPRYSLKSEDPARSGVQDDTRRSTKYLLDVGVPVFSQNFSVRLKKPYNLFKKKKKASSVCLCGVMINNPLG